MSYEATPVTIDIDALPWNGKCQFCKLEGFVPRSVLINPHAEIICTSCALTRDGLRPQSFVWREKLGSFVTVFHG